MAITITNKNVKLINRKEPQFMTPAPANTTAGSFVITDIKEDDNTVLFVVSSILHYLYLNDEDGWVQVPSGALGGTFGAGSCGHKGRWSSILTANGGSTTNATISASISALARGSIIRFLTGANAGLERVVTDVLVTQGASDSFYFDALPNVVSNNDTFIIDTGRFFIWNAGTMSASSFKVYDPLLGTWTSLSVTGMPATWGTDGKMVVTPSYDVYASGTTTSATSNTLTNSSKTWTTNQWTNYQIRITSGTGIGQVRTIASNTGTQITVSANWTVTPSTNSVFEITGNDDFIYLLGNGAVTMYRYSISSNSWTTLSPTTARSSAPSTGMSANWMPNASAFGWDNESSIRNGRYIFSFRGGATATLHRYDIALNAWVEITYPGAAETFTTGSSYVVMDRYIYIRQNNLSRMFKFSVSGNYLEPIGTTFYPESTALMGDKMWGVKYIEDGDVKLKWLYWLGNNNNILHRMLIY
jgi:hypothetical protein